MIDHDALLPSEDINTSGGPIPTNFEELLPPTPDTFGPDMWKGLEQDISTPSVSRALRVRNDDPNSSHGCDLDIAQPLAGNFNRPHDAPATLLVPDQPATCGNHFSHLDNQVAEGCQDTASATDGALNPNLSPAGNAATSVTAPTLDDGGGVAWMAGLPEDLAAWIDSLDIPDPTSPLPGESLGTGVPGLGCEMLNWDFVAPPLNLSPNLAGQPNLFGPLTTPTSTPLEASIPEYKFGLDMNYVLVDPPIMPIEFGSSAVDSYVSASPPPDFPTPFLSPALTDSSGSDWSLASDGSSVYSPLLLSLTALVPVGVPVALDHPSAFPSPASVEEAFEIKAEIDKYVDSLTAQRRHRGSAPSLVKLKCSWCDKKERRPSELKEHMYAHRGLALFPCPNKGCKHVSNRASNLTRHLHKCDPGSKE